MTLRSIQRTATFQEERSMGEVWRDSGRNSEYGRLREVVLRMPGPSIRDMADPDACQFLERPDLDALVAEIMDIGGILRHEGVNVHVLDGDLPFPNLLYMRDLFFSTRGLTFLARPATTVRSGEERHVAQLLAGLGVPLHVITTGRFEASDLIYIKPDRVIYGYGNRSDLRTLNEILMNTGGTLSLVGRYTLPARTQHLLGIVNVVDEDVVLARGIASNRLLEKLDGCFERVVVLEETREVVERQAMNVVALAPSKVLMPDDCPETRRLYEREGLEVVEAGIAEVRKGAGGLGCLVGTLSREIV